MIKNGIECDEYHDIYVDEEFAINNAQEYIVNGEIIKRDVHIQVKEGFNLPGKVVNG